VITARYVLCPYRYLLSVVLPDDIVATAKSSRAARMAVFMMIVVLSGQQTECCSGSLRRYLYRELLGGSSD